MTDDEEATTPTGTTRYPATVAERAAKGTSGDIIDGQTEATAAKTARLRAAREARDAEQAVVDAEALRNVPPKRVVKKRVPKA